MRDGADHGFDHVARFRCTGRYRSDFHRRDGDAHTGRKDVPVSLAALEFVDQHEAARIAQPGDGCHRVHALEGRQHHRQLEADLVLAPRLAEVIEFADEQLAFLDASRLGVGDPLHVVSAQFAFKHALAVAHAAEAHVTNIGLTGDEGDGHPVAQLALAQVGVDDEGEFVGGAEAARARHGADDDRARILQEFLVVGPELLGMLHRAHGVRVSAVRPRTRDLVEAQLGAGGDDQVVVVQRLATVKGEAVGFGVDGRHCPGDEADALPRQWGRYRHGDHRALAPADRHPGVGRGELKAVGRADDGDAVFPAEQRARLVGGRHATDAGTDDHDMGHDCLLGALWGASLRRRFAAKRTGSTSRLSRGAQDDGTMPTRCEDNTP